MTDCDLYSGTKEEFLNGWKNVPWTSQRKKNTFVVERRYIGPPCTWYAWNRDWHRYRKYRTEKDMLKGFEAAVKKSQNSRYPYEWRWEYRII